MPWSALFRSIKRLPAKAMLCSFGNLMAQPWGANRLALQMHKVCRGLERLDGLVRQGQREQAEVRVRVLDHSLTFETLAKELAVAAAAATSGTALRGAVQRAEAAASELEGLAEQARGRDEQRM